MQNYEKLFKSQSVWRSIFSLSGPAMITILASVLRQGVLLIPSLYIMHALFGYIGIAFSHTVVDISAALIGLILFLRQYRKFMAS